jgi:hypothetical protein
MRLGERIDIPLIELLLRVGGQHGVVVVRVGGCRVNLRHGGRVAAGGGLLCLGYRLSFSFRQSRRATEETEARRESAPTYAGCTHGGARLEKLVKVLVPGLCSVGRDL